MTVGQEPGNSTMIRISIGTKEALNALKNDKSEAIGDVVKRLVRNDQKLHKISGDTHTKERLENDLKTITDPLVPDEGNPKKIWLDAHPNERLEPLDVIHHINGYHDDNREENLMRVTMSEHGRIHAEIRGSVQKPISRPLGCLAPEMPSA
jgi:hypothetical protein